MNAWEALAVRKLARAVPPVQKLRELFLSVADVVDGSENPPLYLVRAYMKVWRTKWGQKIYSEAVEEANARIPV